jgi:site-specific DNA-cytosine methylase
MVGTRFQALALKNANIAFRIVGHSECDPIARQLMQVLHNFVGINARGCYVDVVSRPLVKSDLYGATSPCTSFSLAGSQTGHVFEIDTCLHDALVAYRCIILKAYATAASLFFSGLLGLL